jgi:N-terminal domain of anti-restriction factor ArdC
MEEEGHLVHSPLRSNRKRQPIRTTLRCASSAPLRFALRCAEWALSRVPSVATRGNLPFQKHQTKRRRHTTMERQTRQSADIPKWSTLLVEAVNKPGLIMKAYSNFHSYSIGNQLLALVQCYMRGLQPGPINTFPKWQALGRYVKRGERALTLCMPITCRRRGEASDNDESNGEGTFTSFVHKARWFVLAQTGGEDLEPQVTPEWEAKRALAALDIELIAFDSTDGNCQGFARKRQVASTLWPNFHIRPSSMNLVTS